MLAGFSRWTELTLARRFAARRKGFPFRDVRPVADHAALKFPRGTTRALDTSEHCIAEKFGDDFASAEEVHLKPMRLFRRAPLGIDAPYIFLRERVRLSCHHSLRRL